MTKENLISIILSRTFLALRWCYYGSLSGQNKDKDAIDILIKIINSYKKGLPIGLYSSQLLSIFCLNDLAHHIQETLKVKYYIRYQDDMIIIDKDK